MDNRSCSNWISTVIYRQLSTSVPRKTKGLLKDDAITGDIIRNIYGDVYRPVVHYLSKCIRSTMKQELK
jgi:hypothetical protein